MTLSSRAIEAGARAIAEARRALTGSESDVTLNSDVVYAEACLTAALAAEGMVLVTADALSYAGQMSNLCFNYKQSPSCDEKLREAMSAAHRGFDRAMLSAHQEDEKSEGKNG